MAEDPVEIGIPVLTAQRLDSILAAADKACGDAITGGAVDVMRQIGLDHLPWGRGLIPASPAPNHTPKW
jgi:hypothetical protein